MVKFIDGYAALQDRLNACSSYGREVVDSMYSKAVGYGWGREDDATYKRPEHGGDALDFATAYATAWLDHTASQRSMKALREAYTAWHRTGEVK